MAIAHPAASRDVTSRAPLDLVVLAMAAATLLNMAVLRIAAANDASMHLAAGAAWFIALTPSRSAR